MATGVLGLGTGQASTLNSDLITKLKDAETASLVTPIQTKIDNITNDTGEAAKLTEITTKANELLDTIKPFYQFATGQLTVFDLKTANTTGSSVVFDTTNEGALNVGTTTVKVNQLASKDVYQSFSFDSTVKTTAINSGTVNIAVAGADGSYSTSYAFDTTNKTYDQLATEINNIAEINASVEQVADNSYRLVIKSADTGSANALKISESSPILGAKSIATNAYTATNPLINSTDPTSNTGSIVIDGTTYSFDTSATTTDTYQTIADTLNGLTDYNASIDSNGYLNVSRVDGTQISITQDDFGFGLTSDGGKTLTAKNMKSVVDGIAYESSSNVITVDNGLKITAVSVDSGTESTINIQNDTGYIESHLQSFVDKYNEFMTLVSDQLNATDSPIQDKATLKSMVQGIKDKLFQSYGVDNAARGSLNVFSFGLELDKTGALSINSTKLNDTISNNLTDLKSLFFDGYYYDSNNEAQTIKGLGTELKDYLDNLDGYDGLLTSYQTNMDARKTKLETERDKATASLDSKYNQLAQQFADYGAIITRFNAQYSGLQMMIQQSVSTGN